jgi:hypothetical protein
VRIALLICVCEGEESIAWDVLSAAGQCFAQAEVSLFVVDDASPSRVGQTLVDRFAKTFGQSASCRVLPKSLRFYGTAERLFRGLSDIASSGKDFDAIVKLESDICIVRQDLLAFVEQVCPDGVGLYGERYGMRARDSLLLAADLVPAGFARERVDGIIQRKWRFGRLFPVWWADIGRRAFLRGYRFGFIAGSFWVLGGKTLRKMAESGWLARDYGKTGFVFADDVLITVAAHAVGDPVVDLGKVSPHWGRYLSITDETPTEAFIPKKPYVVHHLKNHAVGWKRRQEIKRAFGWPTERSAIP